MNVDVPAVVGVPEIAPDALFNVSPVGKLPVVIDHVYGVSPPAAARVWPYEVPVVPEANVEVLMPSCTPIAAPARSAIVPTVICAVLNPKLKSAAE